MSSSLGRADLLQPWTSTILCAAFFLIAALYTTVGQAGSSGYLAVMALVGLAPAVMRPTALVLNLLVATLTAFRFAGAGYFSWRAFLPFGIGSGPRRAAGIAAPFILANAAAVLMAGPLTWAALLPELPALAIAVAVGALLGTWLGLRWLSLRALLATLAAVLALASARLLLGM